LRRRLNFKIGHLERRQSKCLSFTFQEARLGPIAAAVPTISGELATLLKGRRATSKAWMAHHQGDGIPANLAAFAAAVEVIEKYL
jgi:hypothetical protein